MAFVYILYSKKSDSYYTGSCLDITTRIAEHNSGKYAGGFTSKAEDWELQWSMADLSYSAARNIEAHIKKMKSRVYIQNLMKYPEMAAKLREKYS